MFIDKNPVSAIAQTPAIQYSYAHSYAQKEFAEQSVMTSKRLSKRQGQTLVRKTLIAGCSVLALTALVACAETETLHGLIPDKQDLASIKPGVHKRSDVQVILGAPSTVSNFESDTWYYVGNRVKTELFFKPEVLERKVVTVKFDEKGVVEKVETIDSTKTEEIALVERETPTKGKDLTVIQQLLGNIGRFALPEEEDGSTPGF